MKNILKYIAVPSLSIIVFILIAVNYGQRLRFGDAYFENDTANKILTNKSLYFESGDSIYYNGVVVTSGTGGGGIAASDNITFTGTNTFNQNVTMADSKGLTWSNPSSVKSTSGALIYNSSSHNFNTQYGTYLFEADSITGFNIKKVLNGTSDSITTTSKFYFSDTVKTNSRFIATDLARFNDSLVMSSYDIFLPNGKGLNWGELTGQIYSNAGELISRSATHTSYTLHGNFLNSSDSTNGFLVREKLEGYADTISSSSKFEFNDIVTFALSPVFSALVTFANGITVTGTATFNGDMLNTGWKSQGSSQNQYKYSRDTVLKMVLNTTSGTAFTDTIRHGITNWRSIVFTQFIVHEDSANVNCIIGLYANDAASASLYGAQAWTDSLFARVRLPGGNGNSTAWRGDTCTVYIKYTDYNR